MKPSDVSIVNLKKLLPACRRCRIRSDEMLRNMHQPMICSKCQGVIEEEFSHFISIDPIPFEQARECLFNHERECSCWEAGVRFPEAPAQFGLDLKNSES